jgi:hypothetical protein
MPACAKLGGLLAIALTAAATVPAGAGADHRAVVVNPDNAPVTGVAIDPTVNYEGVPIQCDRGTVSGVTGINSDIVDLELAFYGNCNVNGLPANDVECDGSARVHFLSADDGEVDRLHQGFLCEVVVPDVCTLTIPAQELPIDLDGDPTTTDPGDNQADPIDGQAIDFVVDMYVESDNPAFCGPGNGAGGWSGLYDLNVRLTFD